MDRIFPLDQLDIIGCKEVPVSQPAMPRLLSAIFAVRDSDMVLFPPYTLGELEVVRPDVSTREEFEDLVACEKISSFGPVPAISEHELWLNDSGEIHYDPNYVARSALARIFETRCGSAMRALKSRLFDEARVHSLVAYSANPRSLDPLRYRAAAEHLMASSHPEMEKFRAELALTEMLAESHLSIPEFKKLYLELVRESPVASAVCGTMRPRPENRSKYAGIAGRKPSPSKVPFRELCHA